MPQKPNITQKKNEKIYSMIEKKKQQYIKQLQT